MEPQKELEYLREKVALLEKCLEYERLLRDMREAAPREPVYVPYPVTPPQPWQPWVPHTVPWCDSATYSPDAPIPDGWLVTPTATLTIC